MEKNQMQEVQVQSKVVPAVAVALGLAAVSFVAGGIIMMSFDKVAKQVDKNVVASNKNSAVVNRQIESIKRNAVTKKEAFPSGSTSLSRRRSDDSDGGLPGGGSIPERLTDLETDYKWSCTEDMGNHSPMLIADTSMLEVNGKITLTVDDPDAIRSFDDLPGIYVPDYTSISGSLIDRVRVYGLIGKGVNDLDVECAEQCRKDPNSDEVNRYINHVYSWPDPTPHASIEEVFRFESGIPMVEIGNRHGDTIEINIIEEMFSLGLEIGDMLGTIHYNYVAIDNCNWYNCCNEAVGEVVVTEEMIEGFLGGGL